jgi:hypothetical protein
MYLRPRKRAQTREQQLRADSLWRRLAPITSIVWKKIMQDRKGGCYAGGALRIEGRTAGNRNMSLHALPAAKRKLILLQPRYKRADYEQSGETMTYVDKGDSGQPVYRHFCGGCGPPIFAKTALAPRKVVVVKAGTLDRLEGLQPQTEIYTDHAVKWLAPVAGATRFAQNL